jgi:hypothetical protein
VEIDISINEHEEIEGHHPSRSTGIGPRNEGRELRQSLRGGQAMRMKSIFINALLAASLAAGVAVAQDAPPPPPDSQYPATNAAPQSDSQYPTSSPQQSAEPQYEKQSDPVYATQDSQTAPAPPEQGQLNTAPAPASPDQQAIPDDSQDPSSRVARMQFMDGQVSIQPGGVNDWVAGTLNRPMTTGDNVWTDKGSKAELNVGTGVFRMGAETSVTLANVADQTTQLQLHQGTLNLRVRHLYDGETYEVDTPNMAFTIQKPGDYRFDVDPNADTSYVTVWKGEGNATGDGPSVAVRQGDRAKFSNGTSMAYNVDRAPGYDQFDQWAMSRDQRMDNSQSAKYVSPDVIGSSDLDDYGKWQNNNQYGNVWVPNDQNNDLQPYTNGNWTYEQPYGWTWVGYEPWGFAPYHYGRWVYGGWGWGWAPGPYAYWGRPYYAPALVAWYGGGWGGGFGWGIGFGGGWGWCPLGFGEAFHPWYHVGPRYFRNVNIRNTRITNITNITNNYYRNRGTINNRYNSHVNYQRGLVYAKGDAVTRGLSIRNNRMSLNGTQRAQLMQHPVNSRNMSTQLRPTQEARLGGAAAMSRHITAPPARATSRQTFAKNTPPSRGNEIGNRSTFNGRTSTGLNSGRNVPRPNAGVETRGSANVANNGHYVPRPPSAGGAIGNRNESRMPSTNHGAMNAPRANSNVPRPSGSTYSRPGQSYNAPRPSNGGRAYNSSPYGRGYGSPSYSRPSNPGYNARSYGSPNGGGRSYSAPQAPHYSAPAYGGNRGGGYSAPHYSAPHYSAPSGGGHYSAPSYHGGGGGYHGGGGGSSHASSGGHSGGGGHGRH